MSEEAPPAQSSPSKKEELPPELLKEASFSLLKDLEEFCKLGKNIQLLERELAVQRNKRTNMLREKPWLGNVQGILNKEAAKEVKKYLTPPEIEEIEHSSDMLVEEQFEAKATPQVPKKKTITIQPAEDLESRKAHRRLMGKILEKEELSRKANRQFPPGHPARRDSS